MRAAPRSVTSFCPAGPRPTTGPTTPCRPLPPRHLEARGRIKRLTHAADGEVNGFLLDDGTAVRFEQGLAPKDPECLVPGRHVAASGIGLSGALGKVVSSRAILLVPAAPDDRASVQLRCDLESVRPPEAGGRKLPLINPPATSPPSQ